MMPSTMSAERSRRLNLLLSVLFWLFAWEIAALAVGQEFLLASPFAVLRRLFLLLALPGTWLTLLLSSFRILAGFFLSLFFGAALAFLSFRHAPVRRLLLPPIYALRAVPVANFVLLAVILVPLAWLSTLIAFLTAFPVLYTGMLESLQHRDHALDEMARVFRVPAGRRLSRLTLPQLLPTLRADTATALGLSIKSGVAAEVIGIPRGSIGEQLYSVKVNFLTADLFAWTLIIVLINLLFASLLRKMLNVLEKRLKGC